RAFPRRSRRATPRRAAATTVTPRRGRAAAPTARRRPVAAGRAGYHMVRHHYAIYPIYGPGRLGDRPVRGTLFASGGTTGDCGGAAVCCICRESAANFRGSVVSASKKTRLSAGLIHPISQLKARSAAKIPLQTAARRLRLSCSLSRPAHGRVFPRAFEGLRPKFPENREFFAI